MTQRHKVFVSYHHANDQGYRDQFERLFADVNDILVSKSVQIGDIGSGLKTETIRQKIRDEYLKDSTVTVVLIGTETWKRKHVDWEIASSIRSTEYNPRSGLLGIFLPDHPDHGTDTCSYCMNPNNGRDTWEPYTIPPRLHYNARRGYANLYDWNTGPYFVQKWIHDAFKKRNDVTLAPDNSYPLFAKNRSGDRWFE